MALARLESDRLVLEPLSAQHVEELGPLLDDAALHEFIGGNPPSPDELSARIDRQVRGRSPDGRQRWLNWVLRLRATNRLVGTAQATVWTDQGGRTTADLAWVIGTEYQGRGLAKEAAGAVSTWLREQGVQRLGAHIHPDHLASMAVARSIGLAPTERIVDGEVRWQTPPR